MPWQSKDEVPASLQSLSLAKANQWAAVFDAAKADGKSADEAAKIAWGAVKASKWLAPAARTMHELVIKANPPVFNKIVLQLEDALARAFGVTSTSLVMEAVGELAEIAVGSGTPAAKKSAADKVVTELSKKMGEAGADLDDDLKSKYGRLLAAAFKLGKDEIARPLGWSAAFTIADRDVLAGLQDSGVFWIGNHYGGAFDSEKLRDIVRQTVAVEGLGARGAGRRLAATLGQQIQRSDVYWRGLASTVATRARSFGALSSMQAIGCTRYEFVNPLDDRTSDVCRRLDGTVFYVKGAVELRDKLLATTTPDEWKATAPWPKVSDLETPTGELLKPTQLQAKGIAWPPLHFHCRSSIVVRVFQPLGKGQADPLGDVQPVIKPPKKPPIPAVLPDVVPDPPLPPPWQPDMPALLVQDLITADDWRPVFALNGYTDEEIAALLQVDELIGLITQATPDTSAVAEVLLKFPPASPKALNHALIIDNWIPLQGFHKLDEGDVLVRAVDVLEVTDELVALGYSTKERKALWGGKLPKAEQALGDFMRWSTYHESPLSLSDSLADVALFLQRHPPGKVPPPKLKAPVAAPVPPPAAPPPPPPKPKPAKAPPPAQDVPEATPAPKPDQVPSAPVTQASQLPATPVPANVHTGYGWTPADPPKGITVKGKLAGKKRLTKYLLSVGYSKDEAAKLVPQLLDLKPGWDAIAVAAPTGQKAATLKGLLRSWLEERPPGKLVALPPAPPAFLDPEEFGARLAAVAGVKAPGNVGDVFTDQADGARWFVRFHKTPEQARSEVVANALYRRLDVEAPESRVVIIDGQVGVASREWTSWQQVSPADAAAAHGERLAAEFPVDAWLGNWNVAGTASGEDFVRMRANPIPGQSPVLRSDNAGVLSFRYQGASKPSGAWSADQVGELESLLDPGVNSRTATLFGQASADPSLMLPMMDRIAGLTDDELAGLVRLGGFADGEAQDLVGVLAGRRTVIKTKAKELRAELKAAQERAAAMAAELEARRRALEEAIARGDFQPGVLRRGSTIPSVVAQLEEFGATGTIGDADKLHQQLVRFQRYRMRKGSSVVHEGYEIRMRVQPEYFDRVVQGARRRGAQSRTFRAWQRAGGLNFKAKTSTASDRVINYNQDQESAFLGSGWVVRGTDSEIDFAAGNGLTANQGELRILVKTVDPEQAQRELDRVLADLGLDDVLVPPTDDAELIMKANQVGWNLDAGGHKPVRTAAAAKALLKRHGLKPADVEVVDYGKGFVQVRVPKLGPKAHKSGVRYLYHEYSNKNSEAVLASLVGGDGAANPGLLGTVERSANGIVVSGASSGPDMNTGGAFGVFVRVVGKQSAGWYESFGPHKVLIGHRELERVDWWGYNSDKYGDTRGSLFKDRPTRSALLARQGRSSTSSNEIMLPHQVARSSMLGIAMRNESGRQRVLGQLRGMGITEVRGRPVEEFVVVMSTPTDFSNLLPAGRNPYHDYLAGRVADYPDEDW